MFILHRKQDFSYFCYIPCFVNSCMEEVQVGVIYNTLLDSNKGDLSPYASQTIYFSNINENKISDRETPVELLSLEPQYGTEPLLISSISIRHSEASSCCSPLKNLSYCTSRNLSTSTSVELYALQYIPRNMHTVFALLCFVVVIHWLIFPYPSGLLHWHCGNLTIAPVPTKQPWWIWINTSCEFIMNDCITTTKQSTTKPYAYFLGYTVHAISIRDLDMEPSVLKLNWTFWLIVLRIEKSNWITEFI